MDILSIVGFIGGIGVLVFGIISGGDIRSYWDKGSVFITIGGTITALMLNFPLKSMKNVLPAMKNVFFTKKQDPIKIINTLVELAEQARKGGLLSLEEKAKGFKDEFMSRAVMTVIDSHDPQSVREMLETELNYVEERHGATHAILEKGASYAPAFGMIGTLIGLINMLRTLDKPDTLGPNMSIAMITTFYGSVLANVIFLPMAGKLKVLSANELFCKQLIIEGVLAIQVGENPRLIKEKLMGYLPQNTKNKKAGAKGAKEEKDGKAPEPKRQKA